MPSIVQHSRELCDGQTMTPADRGQSQVLAVEPTASDCASGHGSLKTNRAASDTW